MLNPLLHFHSPTFYRRVFFTLCGLMLLCLLSSCGFHLAQKSAVPDEFKVIRFYSTSQYSTLTREVRSILDANHVEIINNSTEYSDEEKQNYPSLYIEGTTSSTTVISIFPNGSSAESQKRLDATGKVVFHGKTYPLKATIFRNFFDNPATALAKSTESDLIEEEMYKQVAEKLVDQLHTVLLSDADQLSQANSTIKIKESPKDELHPNDVENLSSPSDDRSQ